MSIARSSPVPFIASGVTDALDGTNAPRGSMAALVNLVPDPTTNNQFICRPASIEETDFTGFTNPGFISVIHVRGNLVFGLIASDTNPGQDEPFCFNLTTGAFVTVTGATAGNTPDSPASTGEWNPPIIAAVGVYLVVTHPGFDGITNFFGWFDISNLAAPTWSAGNTATQPLTAVPISVASFGSRAWFAVENALVYSDALDPLTVTGADQVLILGDTTDITALGSLQLNTQYGGIIQALIAFKGATNMYQITGDETTNDLAQNVLDVATGTLAPNTIASTPYGMAFISPGGLRIIDADGNVTEPIGNAGSGVTVPFTYAVTPSRMCAAFNNNVYRVTVQNGLAIGTPNQEWWYDFTRKIWTGPHTFYASLIQPFTSQNSDLPSFLVAPLDIEATLWDSMPLPTTTSTYTENGVALAFEWVTSVLPDTMQMAESSIVEATINMSLIAGMGSIVIVAYDEDGTVLDTASLTPTGAATVWGAFTWGAAVWRGSFTNFKPQQIGWTEGITYRWLQVSVVGTSVSDYRIGNMFLRTGVTGFLQQTGRA